MTLAGQTRATLPQTVQEKPTLLVTHGHYRLLGTFESERDVAQTRILGVGLDLESQFPAHFQHDRIFVENLAAYAGFLIPGGG